MLAGAATVNHNVDIIEDEVWEAADIHRIAGPVRVAEAVTLTIEAGTIVKFNWQLAMTVDGTLVANGTEEDPILFTSDMDDTGFDGILGTEDDDDTNSNGPSNGVAAAWQNIILTETSANVVLEHAEFRFAGNWNAQPTVHIRGGEPVLRNCSFLGGNGIGVRIEGANPIIEDCTFQSNRTAPFSMDLSSDPILSGLTLEGHTFNAMLVDGGEISEDAIWDNPEVVYRPGGSITVLEGITFTISAGQVIKWPHFSTFRLFVNGTLIANGTLTHPVVFTEDHDDSAGGDTNNDDEATLPTTDGWSGITLAPGSLGNILRHTEIRYTGRGGGHGLHVNGAELTMNGGSIRSSGLYTSGLRIDQSDPTVTNVSFTGHLAATISMDLASNPTLTGCSLENNQWNGAWIATGELPTDAVWDEADVVFLLSGPVTVPEGITLRLGPGQVVKGRTHTQDRLIVNGTLLGEGTPEQPVILTDHNDDTAGGDTNNNGNASPPVKGGWAGLEFNESSQNCVLEHTEIRYAGPLFGQAVLIDGAEIELARCVVADANGNGLIARNNAVVRLSNSLILSIPRSGLQAETGASLIAINNTIDGDNFSSFNTGVSAGAANVTLINNIISNNRFAGISGISTSSFTVAYNDVFNPDAANGNYHGLEDQTGLNGNLSEDPLFFSRADKRFSLISRSPAIDRGISVNAPEIDHLGRPRFDDPNVANLGGGVNPFYDLGALERQDESDPINLVVDSFTSDVSEVAVGDIVSLTWTVRNAEVLTAEGDWNDSIFASNDPRWDITDTLVGEIPHTGGLAPGANYNAQTEIVIPASLAGPLYLIVRTDGRQALRESIETDNEQSVSLQLDIPFITTGEPLQGQFQGVGDAVYYRISVSPGQTLTLSLDSEATSGSTGLYLRRGAIPSSDDYDIRHSGGYEPDQQLVIPTTQAGDYYLMAVGQSGLASTSAFTLTALVTGLKVQSLAPAQASNIGPITFKVKGSRFTLDSEVSLIGPGGATLDADQIFFQDAATVFATFDLNGFSAGNYDLNIQDGETTDSLQQGLLVVEGGEPGRVEMDTHTPPLIRRGWDGQLTIEYKNVGDTDVAAPMISVSAMNTLFRAPDEDFFSLLPVQLLCINTEGPAGVLPPGASGVVILDYRPQIVFGDVEFSINELTDNFSGIDWDSLKDELRPPLTTPEAWEGTFQNFKSSVGTTFTELHTRLITHANHLSRFGIYTYDVNHLLSFELSLADNTLALSVMDEARDIFLSTPGLLLSFDRTFFHKMRFRNRLGPLGRAWLHNWEISLEDEIDYLLVNLVGTFHVFYPLPNGEFTSDPGEHGILEKSGDGFLYTDPRGIEYAFTANGQFLTLKGRSGEQITASHSGNRLSQLTHSNGNNLQIQYDASGKISKVTASDGTSSEYFYDGTEYLIRVDTTVGTYEYTYETDNSAPRRHALRSSTDLGGIIVTNEYDDRGRVIRRTENGISVNVEYGSSGTTTISHEEGAYVRLSFDDRGNMVGVDDDLGNKALGVYDGDGNLHAWTSSDGSSTSFEYGETDIRLIDTFGNSTVFEFFDAAVPSTAVTDVQGHRTLYEYDDQDRNSAIVFPDGSADKVQYDDEGNIEAWENRNGEIIRFEYNENGDVVHKEYPDGTSLDYSYDDAGRLLNASDSTGSIDLEYDDSGSLKKVTYPDGRFLEYSYGERGLLKQLKDQDGVVAIYEHDDEGRLVSILHGDDTIAVTYQYDGAGRLIRQNMGNGTATTFDYDRQGRLLQVVNYDVDGGVQSEFDYQYDAQGRRFEMSSPQGISKYQYDNGGRLTKVEFPEEAVTEYSYDAAGNFVEMVEDGMAMDFEVNSLDQYIEAGGTGFVYDLAGNLIETNGPNGITHYDYDFENRLEKVTSSSGKWEYEYDALGNLRAFVMNGSRTEFVVDPMNPLEIVGEYGNGQIMKYIHGFSLLGRFESEETVYYHYDGSGNTSEITSSSGQVLNRYSYGPFGDVNIISQSVPNRFQFRGAAGLTSDGNGLVGTLTRHYDPSLGRFIQPDPIGQLGGMNLYTYAGNDPINRIDDSGLYFTGAVDQKIKDALWTLLQKGIDAAYQRGGGNPAWWFNIFRQDIYPQGWRHLTRNQLIELAKGYHPKYHPKIYEPWKRLKLNKYKPPRGSSFSANNSRWWKFKQSLRNSRYRFNRWLKPKWARGISKATRVVRTVASWGPRVAQTWAAVPVVGQYALAGGAAFAGGYIGGYLINEYIINTRLSRRIGLQQSIINRIAAICRVFGGCSEEGVKPGPRLTTGVVGSIDPNDILGPGGYGTGRYLKPNTLLPYTIRFENQASATAPALDVTITNPLDEDMDLETLEVLSFGFAGLKADLQLGGPFAATVETTNQDGSPLLVRFETEVDVENQILIFTLKSLDPATGLPPADPLAGFLPPNDDTHRGEGFVNYVIRQKQNLTTGTYIDNLASIVFDMNEPIETPMIFNSIDAEAPSSSVAELPAESGNLFQVQWQWDDGEGSGPVAFDVYVSEDGGAFEPWLQGTSLPSSYYVGQLDHQYDFYVEATDGVGWEEATKSASEASTKVTFINDPYHPWMDDYFTQEEIEAGVITLQTADPDADGSSNFIEYTNLTHPRDSASNPMYSVTLETGEVPGEVILTYTRRRDDPSLIFHLEGSPDLKTWMIETPVSQSTEILDDISERVEARYNINSTPRFYRLKVSR